MTATMEASTQERAMVVIQEAFAGLDRPFKGEIKPGLRLDEDIGLDSLDLLEIYMELEGEFDLTPMEEKMARPPATVQDIIDLVQAMMSAKARK